MIRSSRLRSLLLIALAIGAWIAAAAVVGTQAAGARDRAPRLVALATAARWPYSDGRSLVWATASGGMRLLDPRTRASRVVRLSDGCALFSARTDGLALLDCGSDPASGETRVAIARTATGAHVFDGRVVGRLEDWGARWIESYDDGGCYHCDGKVYLDWRTGRSEYVDWMDEEPVDLDAPDLRPSATPPRRRLVRVRRALVLVDGRRRRVIARCREICSHRALWRDRATWVDRPSAYGARGELVERDLRSGREWRWPLERSVRKRDEQGLIDHTTVRVGGVLVLLSYHAWSDRPIRLRLPRH